MGHPPGLPRHGLLPSATRWRVAHPISDRFRFPPRESPRVFGADRDASLGMGASASLRSARSLPERSPCGYSRSGRAAVPSGGSLTSAPFYRRLSHVWPERSTFFEPNEAFQKGFGPFSVLLNGGKRRTMCTPGRDMLIVDPCRRTGAARTIEWKELRMEGPHGDGKPATEGRIF
jgi:hypothetical protein